MRGAADDDPATPQASLDLLSDGWVHRGQETILPLEAPPPPTVQDIVALKTVS